MDSQVKFYSKRWKTCAWSSLHFCNVCVRTVCLIRRRDLSRTHVAVMYGVLVYIYWSGELVSHHCSLSTEQDVPESGFHLLVVTCCHVACKLFSRRQYMRARVSAQCCHSHCLPAGMDVFFGDSCYLQYLMLCECQMYFFWFVDKQPSTFFTSLHRTKQTQRQNLARTRFCLRAHGYVID